MWKTTSLRQSSVESKVVSITIVIFQNGLFSLTVVVCAGGACAFFYFWFYLTSNHYLTIGQEMLYNLLEWLLDICIIIIIVFIELLIFCYSLCRLITEIIILTCQQIIDAFTFSIETKGDQWSVFLWRLKYPLQSNGCLHYL